MSDDAERERARYEALSALVDGYRRERDEAHERKTDLRTMLEQVTRERDEALARCETLRELADAAAYEQGLAQRRMMDAQRERDEARAEVEHAYREGGALYEAKIAEREAFRCGAEAMREACAQWVDHWVSGHVADKLRDMPIPEES